MGGRGAYMADAALAELEAAGEPGVAGDEVVRTPYRLSVVIPAYNEGRSIEAVLGRVMAQLPEAEVIVVDDASKDDTAAIAERAGARVVRQAYNKGNGAAVKAGIRAARGEVILLLDADGQHDP